MRLLATFYGTVVKLFSLLAFSPGTVLPSLSSGALVLPATSNDVTSSSSANVREDLEGMGAAVLQISERNKSSQRGRRFPNP